MFQFQYIVLAVSVFLTNASSFMTVGDPDECPEGYEIVYEETISNQQPQRDLVQAYKCEDGWQLFNRIKGGWCIKEEKTWDYSQEACKRLNANLTGIESLEERKFIHDAGLPIVKQKKRTSNTIWVGGHRTAACKDMGPGCNSQNAYEWIDGHTTGTAMFYWTPNNPDYLGSQQQCVRLYSVNGETGNDRSKPGQMDDTECSTYSWYFDAIGYACGKIAIPL